MLVQQVLDFHHRDVLAAANDQVLAATVDPQIALVVDEGQIAGIEPAVLRGRIEMGALQVAREQRCATNEERAGLAGRQFVVVGVDDLQFHATQRTAVGHPRFFERPCGFGYGDRTTLGHAPGGADAQTHETVGSFDQHWRNRCACTVEFGKAGGRLAAVLDGKAQIGNEGRGSHAEGDAFGAGDLVGARRIPDILQHGRGIEDQRNHGEIAIPGEVSHRRGAQHDVGFAELHHLDVCVEVGEQRVRSVHHRLGFASRARGVHEKQHVVGPQAIRLQGGRVFAQQGLLEAVLAVAADHDHTLQVGQPRFESAGHGRVIKTTEHLWHDEHLGLTETQHEVEFVLAEDRHHRVGCRTEACAGQCDGDEFP